MSQQFGDKRRGLWRLKLYPYGDNSPGGKGHVSLFLSLDTKSIVTQKAYAIFGCYILDDNGQKIQGAGRTFTRQKFAEGSSSWGWSQFVKVVDQNLQSVLVNNETLTIKCEVEVFTGVRTQSGLPLPAPTSLAQDIYEAMASLDHLLDIRITFNSSGPSSFNQEEDLCSNSMLLAARCKIFSWLLRGLRNKVNNNYYPNFSTSRHGRSILAESGDLDMKNGLKDDENYCNATKSPSMGNKDWKNKLTMSSKQMSCFDPTNPTNPTNPTILSKNISGLRPPPLTEYILSAEGKDSETQSKNPVTQSTDPPNNFNSLKLLKLKDRCYLLEIFSPDITYNAVKNLLLYCLTDKIPLLSEPEVDIVLILDLLVAAVHFDCDSLQAACIHSLVMKLISSTNARLVLTVAKKLHIGPLIEACQNFIISSCGEFSETQLLKVLQPPGHQFESLQQEEGITNDTNELSNNSSQIKSSVKERCSPPSTQSTISSVVN